MCTIIQNFNFKMGLATRKSYVPDIYSPNSDFQIKSINETREKQYGSEQKLKGEETQIMRYTLRI